jgi:hypothetical protein
MRFEKPEIPFSTKTLMSRNAVLDDVLVIFAHLDHYSPQNTVINAVFHRKVNFMADVWE